MTDLAEPQINLDQRLTASGWHIARTIALGLAAAGLAVFGEECLAQARPIFPLIDQNYGLWQAAYVGVLLLMGLVWAAAVLQKVSIYQDCQRHIRMQKELEEIRERRALKAQQEREEREAKRKAREEALEDFSQPRFQPRSRRSNKFDY
jgi:hypothetical protein